MPDNYEHLLVKIGGDVADLKSKTGEAKSILDQFGAKAKELGTTIGIAFGAREVYRQVGEMISSAAKAEQQTNLLTSALKAQGVTSTKVRDDILSFSDAMQKKTVFDDDAITASQTLLFQLGRLTGEGLKTAEKATLDLASGLGIDLNTATQLVARAAAGHTETLARYGLIISKTGDKGKDFAQVLSQINQRFGGAAQAATEGSGSFKQFDNSVDDLKKAIGAKLLPYLSTAASAWSKWIDSITEFVAPARETDTRIQDMTDQMTAMKQVLDVIPKQIDDSGLSLQGFAPLMAGADGQATNLTDSWHMLSETVKDSVAVSLNMTRAQLDQAYANGTLADKLQKTIGVYDETVKSIKKTQDAASKPTKGPLDEEDLKKQEDALQKIMDLQRKIYEDEQKKLNDKGRKEYEEDQKKMFDSIFNVPEQKKSNPLEEKIREAEEALKELRAEVEAADAGEGPIPEGWEERAAQYKQTISDTRDQLAALDAQQKQSKETQKDYAQVMDAVQSSVTSALDEMISGGKSADQAMAGIVKGIAQQMIHIAIARIFAAAGVAGSESAAHDAPIIGPAAIVEGVAGAAALFALASRIPHLHTGAVIGGSPGRDRVPVMAERGEEILSRTDPRNAMNGGRSPGLTIIVNENPFIPRSTAEMALDLRRHVRDALMDLVDTGELPLMRS